MWQFHTYKGRGYYRLFSRSSQSISCLSAFAGWKYRLYEFDIFFHVMFSFSKDLVFWTHQRQLTGSFVSPRSPTSFFSQFFSQTSSSSLPLVIPASHSPLVPWGPCHRVGDLVVLVTLLLKSSCSLTQSLGQGTYISSPRGLFCTFCSAWMRDQPGLWQLNNLGPSSGKQEIALSPERAGPSGLVLKELLLVDEEICTGRAAGSQAQTNQRMSNAPAPRNCHLLTFPDNTNGRIWWHLFTVC